ncbi:MAG: M16 family metallopeptidase [Myxococcota bacterium]
MAVAFGAPAGADESRIEDPAERAEVTVFENGLTVVTLVDRSTPVVSFQNWVKVGSRDESRYTGLAHLFEHMMFRGSKNLGPEEHARLINARGGRLNAFTSNDFTVYFEDVTAESLPLVIDLEYERVAHLRIDQEILDTEREVVLEERRLRSEDSPRGRAVEALFATAWIAHPYRTPVIGWRSDVERATVEVCRAFFDRYYVPNNMVIAIVGDFDRDEALAHLQRTFGRLERGADIQRRPTVEPEQRGERRVTVHFDVRSPLLTAGWHAPRTGQPDAEALDVAGQILSAGRSSRLYRSLVYDAEVALFAQGGYWELVDAGIFYAFAGVRPGESVDEVERLFMAEVARMRDEGVTQAEVDRAVRQLEVAMVSGLDTAHALASRVGRDVATFGRIRPLSKRLETYREVTPEDVQRVMQTYLVDDQRSVVQVVPPPAEEAR